MKTINVLQDNDGVRIDRVVRKALANVSLSMIYRFLRKGSIRVNGKRIKQDYRVKTGDVIECSGNLNEQPAGAEDRDDSKGPIVRESFLKRNFHIIFEDESLLVCNKPAGLVVHSGTGHDDHNTLIDCAITYIQQKSSGHSFQEPLLVHRLDRDTSGVILIAKDKQILRALHEGLRNHAIEKNYVALCHGVPAEKKGTIDCSLVKTHEMNRGMKVHVNNTGVRSISTYKVISSRNDISKIAIALQTGKTHQIRVHMAHIGCPIIGDVRYGDKERDRLVLKRDSLPRRLYLHSEEISFFHPGLNRNVTFSAPLPEAFNSI